MSAPAPLCPNNLHGPMRLVASNATTESFHCLKCSCEVLDRPIKPVTTNPPKSADAL